MATQSNEVKFNILSTTTQSYIDEAGNPVNGFRLTFELPEFNEIHTVNVVNLNHTVVKSKIKKIYDDRMSINDIHTF